MRRGEAHGPYWYEFWREGKRTRSRYVGKTLPRGAASGARAEGSRVTFADASDAHLLGLSSPDVTRDELKRAYRRAAFAAHPDRGGTHRRMVEINSALERMKTRRGW